MNRHQLINFTKKIVFPNGEPYVFKDHKLRFTVGSRPIRRKYLFSENDVVRNDVLQIEYFEKNFKADDILWDIGSHHGHYSIFVASEVKGEGQIFSFEPDADARRIQLKNIELNRIGGRITVFDFAVSKVDGIVNFMSKDGDSTSHLVMNGDNTSGSKVISVKSRTLNSLTAELPMPTYVKLDTEGAEIDILSEASQLLRNTGTKFICELHPFAWEAMNVKYEDLISILKTYNRTIQTLDYKKSVRDLPFYGTVLF
jgi:FkbM family methyltransferase